MTPPRKAWHSRAAAQLYKRQAKTMPTLICDCNKTMPLDLKTLGKAIDEDLKPHSTLCRREAGDFQQAIRSGAEPAKVICTCGRTEAGHGAFAWRHP